jgi:acid stress-induced BolA-like protein IbaG/YrbA
MDLETIRQELVDELEGCVVELQSEGNHLTITAIGELFAGKRPVQRQQLIYAILKDYIAEGTVHAVNLKIFTPAEWRSD